jgi:large subunit ribosomal protein L5
METRIHKKFNEEVIQELRTEFELKNVMQVPRLEKIVLNTCISDSIQNVKILHAAAKELTLITGQKAVITRARKSISNFKLREGMPIGAKVTLRGSKMWEFFDRLVTVAMPRIRDFRGISPKGFDGRGNFSMGIIEQLIFPELSFDDIKRVNGMNITFVTTAKNDEHGRVLLQKLGMPFKSQ